jgi:hypothetical protein
MIHSEPKLSEFLNSNSILFAFENQGRITSHSTLKMHEELKMHVTLVPNPHD